jgi:hypothetical protein
MCIHRQDPQRRGVGDGNSLAPRSVCQGFSPSRSWYWVANQAGGSNFRSTSRSQSHLPQAARAIARAARARGETRVGMPTAGGKCDFYGRRQVANRGKVADAPSVEQISQIARKRLAGHGAGRGAQASKVQLGGVADSASAKRIAVRRRASRAGTVGYRDLGSGQQRHCLGIRVVNGRRKTSPPTEGNNAVGVATDSGDILIRVNGKWLIKNMKAAAVPELQKSHGERELGALGQIGPRQWWQSERDHGLLGLCGAWRSGSSRPTRSAIRDRC